MIDSDIHGIVLGYRLRILPVLSCILFTLLYYGCALGKAARPESAERLTGGTHEKTPDFGKISFAHPAAPAGDMLRMLGEHATGGIVFMGGLEERSLGDISFRKTAYVEAVRHIAESLGCIYSPGPYYYFILPAAYASLLQVQPDASLVSYHASTRASAAFGAKNALYNVFSMLGKSLETTIIADNIIAETSCGEMFLKDTPLPYILEAILRSARIAPDSFTVECTSEYVFIGGRDNTSRGPFLLNPGTMPPGGRELLERKVNLCLPAESESESYAAFASTPVSLRDVLLPLTTQLGVEIVAHRRLADMPVNPCRMHRVRLGTALDLLLRQWPVPAFGYEVQEGRILLREK